MRTIEIKKDKTDGHFSEVVIIGKRGKVLRTHYILTSDVKQWRQHFEKQYSNSKQKNNDSERH